VGSREALSWNTGIDHTMVPIDRTHRADKGIASNNSHPDLY
jgi:hypothetical protein